MFRKKKDNEKEINEIKEKKDSKKEKKSIKNRIFPIISYLVFLGIGLIVGYFIKIPIGLSYSILFVFGILAVALNLDEKKMHWLKQIPLFRHHFSLMNRVNQKIGESAKGGTLKEAFKFLIGMIMLILYLFLINIFIILIRLILSIEMPETDPFKFIEAFVTLIGAGITAYIVWLLAFYREMKRLKELRSSKKIVKKMKSGFGFAKFLLKLIPLFFAYLIWIGGEILFMLGSDLAEIAVIVFVLGGAFFGILIICMVCIILFTKAPSSREISNNENTVEEKPSN